MENGSDTPDGANARSWVNILQRYRDPCHVRSSFEIATTVIPFAITWAIALLAFQHGYWLALAAAWMISAGLLVRLFLIQHDCGHGTFFRQRGINDWIGRVLGVLTLTPFDTWRHAHAIHHSSTGHLERRGIGDIDTLTVREYRRLSAWQRLKYRLYRNPLVMFGIGPAYVFLLRHRLPAGMIRRSLSEWSTTMATNLGIAAVAVAMIWLVGLGPFLMVQLPVTLLAGSIGIWLFYVQHQFEDATWDGDGQWNLHEAALHGSSHYDLPLVLRWFTANIGVHHVHHLCSRIPFYRLQQVLRDHPELHQVGRITLFESFRCIRFALWDEDNRRMISFRDLRTMPAY